MGDPADGWDPGLRDRPSSGRGRRDTDVLRLENLDTDLLPAEEALRATREAVGRDDANSWLPITGKADLRRVVADQVAKDDGTTAERYLQGVSLRLADIIAERQG
jgi:aspartate/methionine/tyrosine aminotransferase